MKNSEIPIEKTGNEMEAAFESEVNRAVLNTVLDGIITITPDGTVIKFNPAAEKIFGYESSEVIGRNVRILMPEPYRSEHDTYINNYLRTGREKIIGIGREVKGQRKDGSEFPLDLAVTEMRVDGRRMFTGILRDITENKKVEAALKESEAKFRTLSEDALIGIYLIQDMRFEYVNPELAQMLKYTVDELTGMKDMLECVHPDQQAIARQGMESILKGQHPGLGYHGMWLQKDGAPIEVEGKAAFTLYRGRPAIIGTALDISERRFLERQRTDFLAMITHDFKSPLTTILANAELISMIKAGADVETAGMADAILRSGERLRRLVEDFLVHSRLDSEGLAPEFAVVNVRDALKGVISDFRNLAARKALSLEAEFAPGIPALYLDARLIQRAVSNLLQNAINYTPGGGRIRLKAEMTFQDGRDFMVISVSDTGSGIPLAEQSKIFQKYYRTSRGSRSAGTGLGLAIVKAVTEAHRGWVELESVEGKGSTFRLVIPEDLKANQAP